MTEYIAMFETADGSHVYELIGPFNTVEEAQKSAYLYGWFAKNQGYRKDGIATLYSISFEKALSPLTEEPSTGAPPLGEPPNTQS